jgi:hypothetical protein
LQDEVFATPAIAEGRLYVRTKTALFAFGERARAGIRNPASGSEITQLGDEQRDLGTRTPDPGPRQAARRQPVNAGS